jgi:hypothetical protein
MTIINQPSELYHSADAQLRPVPAENTANAYFSRAWEEETTADGVIYRIDRVRSVGGSDVYGIDIDARILAGWANAFSSDMDDRTRLSLLYSIKGALLEKAEGDGITDLSPLDSATEQAEYETWLEDQIGE